MEELINIYKTAYFKGILDALESGRYKLFKYNINHDLKAKIYDLGYITGYNNFIKYIKNNL